MLSVQMPRPYFLLSQYLPIHDLPYSASHASIHPLTFSLQYYQASLSISILVFPELQYKPAYHGACAFLQLDRFRV